MPPDQAPEPAPPPAPLARRAPPPAGLRPDLVIPCHNDAVGLARLLARVERLACFARVIVVDDGSDVPVAEAIAPAPGLTVLRRETPGGGGVARNEGLRAVTADHVLFFDADDLITAELPLLLADLAGAGRFDFCQFRYADSRTAEEGLWGQPEWDERFWAQVGRSVGALAEVPPGDWPVLAQTANYPWNKLYDTGFLRAHGIGCAETAVHQDIPLHWLGYLEAGRVLVSDRVCGWHEVRRRGARLTNRAGRERLEVFAALEPVAARLGGGERLDWQAALAEFSLGLVDWGAERIAPELAADLRAAEADWLGRHFGAALPALASARPALAARLAERIG